MLCSLEASVYFWVGLYLVDWKRRFALWIVLCFVGWTLVFAAWVVLCSVDWKRWLFGVVFVVRKRMCKCARACPRGVTGMSASRATCVCKSTQDTINVNMLSLYYYTLLTVVIHNEVRKQLQILQIMMSKSSTGVFKIAEP